MPVLKLKYFVYDVFTDTVFLGNPLAVVHVPASASLTHEQKQKITKEFNFAETTFVHEETDIEKQSTFNMNIFTPISELPFAGHPTVGTGFHLLSSRPNSNEILLRIKAGDTPVVRSGDGRVSVDVPVDFKVHPAMKIDKLVSLQPRLHNGDMKDSVPGLASISKGMNFALFEMSSVDALGRLIPHTEDAPVPSAHFGEWYTGHDETFGMWAYNYIILEDGGNDRPTKIRARMFSWIGWEDPATGSAASTLAGYLGLKKGKGTWKFEITQGVEMGRKSDIAVVVEIGEGDVVKRVQLQGLAVKVMEGTLDLVL